MQTEILAAGDPGALRRALGLVREGGVVAFPTDTVYGVGGLATSREAILSLYAIKERQMDKAIPILVGRLQDLAVVVEGLDERARRLAERFWPGALTLVLPKRAGLPAELSQYETVGVRMPDHPITLELLRQAGPMAVTSANISGEASPSTAEEVAAQLSGRIPLILDGGRTPGGVSSTVLDCTGTQLRILRAGPLGLETLKAAVGEA